MTISALRASLAKTELDLVFARTEMEHDIISYEVRQIRRAIRSFWMRPN